LFVGLSLAWLLSGEAVSATTDTTATVPPVPITCTDVRTLNPITHFARHITAAGAVDAAWAPGSEGMCLAGAGSARTVASDGVGVGGRYVAWVDERSGPAGVFLQHITASGAAAEGWPAGGLLLGLGDRTRDDVSLCAAPGGVFVLWHEVGRSSAGNINLLRVQSDGTLASGWPIPGRAVCAEAHDQSGPRCAPDYSGGLFIVWQDRRDGGLALYGTRVDSLGSAFAGWPEHGAKLSELPGSAEGLSVSSAGEVGASTALVTWRQVGERSQAALVAVLVPLAGSTGPPTQLTALVLAHSADAISDPVSVVQSGAFAVAWAERRGGQGSVRVQRVTATGSAPAAAWTQGGVSVASGAPGLNAPVLLPDAQSGWLVGWEDLPSSGSDVRVQRLTASGQIVDGWPQDGVVAAGESGEQYAPSLAPDGSGGAVVTWSDATQESAGGFYLVTAAGMRLEVRLVRADASPGKARVLWQAILPSRVDSLRVDRQVGQEAWSALHAVTVGDSFRVSIEDLTAPEGEQVSYRLVATLDGTEYHFKPALLTIPIAPKRLELHWIRGSGPRAITLACAIPRGSRPDLEVFDVSGRRTFQQTLELEPGEHTVTLTTPSRMRSGVYFVRLRQDRDMRQAKLVFVR